MTERKIKSTRKNRKTMGIFDNDKNSRNSGEQQQMMFVVDVDLVRTDMKR